MLTADQTTRYEEVIKKSRFIAVLLPCDNEPEAIIQLRQLSSHHANASHIAFAYRILTPKGTICRFHDAGEPKGTAGKPIYQHLEGKDLINIMVAVIRYFGGVKLGAGGLTRAYGNSAKHVIEASDIIPYVVHEKVTIILDYKQMQPFEYLLKKLDGAILEQDFATQIRLVVRLPKANLQQLLDAFPALPS